MTWIGETEQRRDCSHVRVNVLGELSAISNGKALKIPLQGQRLLGLIALHRQLSRRRAAGLLWGHMSEVSAAKNLRTTLYRLSSQPGAPLVDANRSTLWLSQQVETDFALVCAAIGNLASRPAEALARLEESRGSLLEGWSDHWAMFEREAFRQERLHALEQLSAHFVRCGQSQLAIRAGLLAVADEPLRESSHRCVIGAHLAEGNRAEAHRQVSLYLDHLSNAGLEPTVSHKLSDLLAAS